MFVNFIQHFFLNTQKLGICIHCVFDQLMRPSMKNKRFQEYRITPDLCSKIIPQKNAREFTVTNVKHGRALGGNGNQNKTRCSPAAFCPSTVNHEQHVCTRCYNHHVVVDGLFPTGLPAFDCTALRIQTTIDPRFVANKRNDLEDA